MPDIVEKKNVQMIDERGVIKDAVEITLKYSAGFLNLGSEHVRVVVDKEIYDSGMNHGGFTETVRGDDGEKYSIYWKYGGGGIDKVNNRWAYDKT